MDPERQEKLLAVLGHELRNPLAAALTGVTLVGEMVDEGDPRKEFLDRAISDLERLARLLSTFLEYGRTRCLRRTPVDLGAVAGEAGNRQAAGEVTVEAEGGSFEVTGDRVLLDRVLDNLLDNAFSAGARHVWVALSRHTDSDVRMEVRDDGPGIPEHLRQTLFEPAVSGRGSSGLGLAIVADVIAAHGGSISLLQGSQSGACFRIILPGSQHPIEAQRTLQLR